MRGEGFTLWHGPTPKGGASITCCHFAMLDLYLTGCPNPHSIRFIHFAFRFTAPWGAQSRRVALTSLPHAWVTRCARDIQCKRMWNTFRVTCRTISSALIIGKYCRAGEVLRKSTRSCGKTYGHASNAMDKSVRTALCVSLNIIAFGNMGIPLALHFGRWQLGHLLI